MNFIKKSSFSCSSTQSGNNTVHTGSFWKSSPNHDEHAHSNGDGVLADQAVVIKAEETPLVEDEIEFHEGWAPTHYE